MWLGISGAPSPSLAGDSGHGTTSRCYYRTYWHAGASGIDVTWQTPGPPIQLAPIACNAMQGIQTCVPAWRVSSWALQGGLGCFPLRYMQSQGQEEAGRHHHEST
jgi:hypothetical protein